jgi:NAD(P)-dependent dehydrogenase (short-subunit alcohol dehydrogenase family)
MGLLDGKVAIITGSGGGIGREYGLLFAKEGAKVVINDPGNARSGEGDADSKMADSVVDEIKAAGGEAVANYDSVADEAGAKNIVQTAMDTFGRLDVLVNNAGVLRDKSMLKMNAIDFDLVIAVHLRGTWLMTKEAGMVLRQQNEGGKIVNTSSLAGLIGNFGQSNYGAAKAGIAGLTRVCSLEFQRYNIAVNALAPVAYTRMTSDLAMFQGDGIDKMLSPEYIAPLGLFLASSLSDGLNGKIFGIQSGKIFEYKMITSEGVDKSRVWTAQEIADDLKNIMK